jgi:hypothetical protein
MQTIDPMKLTGFFDDTAVTGEHIVFGRPDTDPQGPTRTLVVNFGNSNVWTSEGYLQAYAVLGKQGTLTEFEADLVQNSGAWTP